MTRRCLVAVWLLVTLTVTAAGCSDDAPPTAGPVTDASSGTPDPSHSLLAKVPEGGTLRVIVTLLSPDGQTAPPSDNDGRLRAIAQAQDELIRALEPYHAKVDTRYRLYPLLSMVVDRQALAFLLTSPLVKSVSENGLNDPQKAGTLGLQTQQVR
ncbi:hypothetical protein ABGB07_14670 [Micromonosporaceae bacterium B7E4]